MLAGGAHQAHVGLLPAEVREAVTSENLEAVGRRPLGRPLSPPSCSLNRRSRGPLTESTSDCADRRLEADAAAACRIDAEVTRLAGALAELRAASEEDAQSTTNLQFLT